MGGGGDGKIDETEAEKAQAQIAMERFRDYKQDFAPYEDKFISDVADLNSDANYQRVDELAINPLARQFAEEGARMTRDLNTRGVNPNSGKGLMSRSGLNDAQAGAEVDTAAKAGSSQQDNYVTGLKNVVAIGQGQAGEAMQGLSSIAQTSSSYARSAAQDAAQNRSNVQQAGGLVIGAGTRYGMSKIPSEEGSGG